MTTTPRPFVPEPPALDTPAPATHQSAPLADCAARLLGAGGSLVASVTTGTLAVWLPAPWSLVPWALTLAGVAGVVVFGLLLALDLQHAALGLQERRLASWQRDRALTLQRRVYWLHAQHAYRTPQSAAPRIVTVRAWDRPATGAETTPDRVASHDTGRARVSVYPDPQNGTTARYSQGDTQRLELPPPPVWSSAMSRIYELRSAGVAPTWGNCRTAGVARKEWDEAMAGFLALGYVTPPPPGRGYEWKWR